ncbi:MAG: ABC-2 family transporter protein [Chloroflexi bacterium]|nr:ABC-2 family transporter protein [Chloroflexota bacterium]
MTTFAADAGTWRAKARKYRAIARANVQNSLAYAWDALTPGIFVTIFIFIFAQIWKVTFASQNTNVINGLTLNMTIWYFVWAELVQLSKIDPVTTIQNEVKDGSLAYTLGRPYNYVLYHFFHGLGGVGIRLVSVLAFGSFVAGTQAGLLASFRLEVMPLVLFVTVLAFVLDYCIMAMIGLLAFFFEDVMAFRFIYSKITFVLGGLLIPVDFLPDTVQSIARVLPFNLVVYAPSKLFVAWDWEQFGFVVIMQFFWIGVMAGLLTLFYRYGVKRVTINGG